MKIFIIAAVSSFMVSCISHQSQINGSKDIESFQRLTLGQDGKDKVKVVLGAPLEISNSSNKSENPEQWMYARNGIPKIWAIFDNDVLQSLTLSVWESDSESNVDLILKKFSGTWQIQSEEVTNPHSMPTKCYLVDKNQGMKVEIHGYKKVVESISKWSSKGSIGKLKNESTHEVCVANHCTKSKRNNEWKSSHCKWLSAYIK